MNQKRCFSCLAKGHSCKQCKSRKTRVYCNKTGHHRSICHETFGKGVSTGQQPGFIGTNPNASGASTPAPSTTQQNFQILNPLAPPFDPSQNATQCPAATGKSSKGYCRTVLQTALAPLQNPEAGCKMKGRLLFDTAGSRSFITGKMQRQLNLPTIREEWVSVSGFQSQRRRNFKYKVVEFAVVCLDGSTQIVSAGVTENITCPVQKLPLDISNCPPLSQLRLAEPIVVNPEFVGIDVLIGADHYYDFVLSKRVHCPSGPILIDSRLGFLATGRVPVEETGPETIAVMLISGKLAPGDWKTPSFDLERFWEREEIGMKDRSKSPTCDERALESFNSTVRFENNRYEVQWSYQVENPELHDNFPLTVGRLKSLLHRIRHDPKLLEAYLSTHKEQLARGIIEEAPLAPDSNLVYYMPHHPVVSSQRVTTKVRIVYDASSKCSKDLLSLNDCLHRGPVFLEDLCGVLIRFRLNKVALVSNIEKAFHYVGLQPSHRDVTRFLWVRDPQKPASGNNLLVYRFRSVPFGVVSSSFLLGATITHHLSKIASEISRQILRNLYVDNVITGTQDERLAIEFYRQAKKYFSSASLYLREWYSSSTSVTAAFAEADKGIAGTSVKVLGMKWYTEKDSLKCTAVVNLKRPITKRTVLQTMAGIYDPCGLFAPVTVSGKIICQEIWKLGLGWDDPVTTELEDRWTDAVEQLNGIAELEIPRYLWQNQPFLPVSGNLDGQFVGSGSELHVFCDASAIAYSAVVYLRNHHAQSRMVFAKSRVAPLKPTLSIPRLELTAVCIGVTVLQFVESQLDFEISKRFIWTDSKCVLRWIKREKVSTPFVENRVKRLRKYQGLQFRFVPTTDNPADLPTRLCQIEKLKNSVLWWNGPPWLSSDQGAWPKSPDVNFEQNELSSEDVIISQIDPIAPIVDPGRFSGLQRLLRVTAYVFRFISSSKKRSRCQTKIVLASDLGEALTYWIKYALKSAYSSLFVENGPVWSHGIGKQLRLFKDNQGISRCRGRVENAEMANIPRCYLVVPILPI